MWQLRIVVGVSNCTYHPQSTPHLLPMLTPAAPSSAPVKDLLTASRPLTIREIFMWVPPAGPKWGMRAASVMARSW